MADQRITQLNQLAQNDVAAVDLLPIVDISANETKKIAASDLVAAMIAVGAGVQAYDPGLQSIASLATAANQTIYTTGSDTYAVTGLTAAGRALIDDADAAAQRTTLGLGTLATQNGTFSGTHSGNSSGTNTGDQTIVLTGDVTGTGTGTFAATIANNAVTTVKINDAAITTVKINDAAVTAAKLAADSSLIVSGNEPSANGTFQGQQWLNTNTGLTYVWTGVVWQQVAALQNILFTDSTPIAFSVAKLDNFNATITTTLDIQSANTVFAGPTAGGAVEPTFRALVDADLPLATVSTVGAVQPGTGLSVSGSGVLGHTNNTAAGTYTKVTVDAEGHVTVGTTLSAADIPTLDADKIASGSLDTARLDNNSITGAKLANYAISKIGETQPTADHIGQFFFNPLSRDLFLWDGNVYQPIGISIGEIVFAGTFDASAGGGAGLVASVTADGTSVGLVVGQPLPAAALANSRYYLVVSEPGTITSGNAPNVSLSPPDIVLSNGTSWTEIDVSQTVTSQVASNVSFTPAGNISSTHVQAAIEELDNEKLGDTGGTVNGELLIGTTGSLAFEGSTANAFETYIAVVDPTADRTITLPDVSGTVVTTGDTGTVTSTMIANGTIVDADVNASAAITGTKIQQGSTSVRGTVQLTDSTSSTSTTTAATPASVKAAYDLADLAGIGAAAALPKAGGTMTGDITLNAQSDVRFADADSSHWVAFQAPATVTANVTWTLPATDGTNGQALSTNGSGTLSWTNVGTGDVTLNGTQTLTNKTLTDPAIIGTILEDVYTITDGAAFEVDPGNGSVQLITLTASRTPKATNMVAGEALTLMVDDGTAYTLTWTDSTWGTGGVKWTGGSAPTLATSGYTVIQFWKVGSQVYGAYVGDVA